MRAAFRPRSFVRVAGPDAEEYLDRMVSNDVAALGPGESCEALLLTPKARVIAPLVVLRRGHEDFLLLTEPDLGERVRAELARSRFAAKVEIELGGAHVARRLRRRGDPDRRLRRAGGRGARRGADEPTDRPGDELELLRIRAGHARVGQGDRRPRPAGRGGPDRAGGQLHEGLLPGPGADRAAALPRPREPRAARAALDDLPEPDAELVYEGKAVGRITSAATDDDGAVALAYVRREVPDDAELDVGHSKATQLH